MPKDLRTFLSHLESTAPEEVVHIQREIGTKWEITAIQVKLEKEGKYPVIVCDAPVDADRKPSRHRLITNVLADRRRCAEAIGVSPVRVAPELLQKANRKIPPDVVSPREAPVKETIQRGRVNVPLANYCDGTTT